MAHGPEGKQELRDQPAPPPREPLPAAPQSPPHRPPAGRAGHRRARSAANPPPRPGMSYTAPAPIAVIRPTPRAMQGAKVLWGFSFVAGFAVLAGSFLTRDSHLERIRTVVDQMAPGGDASAAAASSAIVFWGSLGAMLLMLLFEAVALALVAARQGWARWVLTLLLPCHAGVLLVVAAFLVPPGDGGYVWLLWSAQVLLAFVGTVFLFVPSSKAWLRPNRPDGRHTGNPGPR